MKAKKDFFYSKRGLKYFFSTFLLWTFSLALWFTGCSDDDGYPEVDGQNPVLTLTTNHIQSAVGRTVSIEGKVSDTDGISTIRLECGDLHLDKTINLIEIYDKPLETYDLNYKFNIQRDETGDQFTIKITVTDVGGRSVSENLLVTMDGDFEKPVFSLSPDKSVTVLMKTETKFNLRFSISDDRALDYVTIEIPGIDGFTPLRFEVNGEKTFDYAEKIILPNLEQEYNVTITAVDKTGKETTVNSVITVSELPNFEKMYLADVATTEELNSDVFGVPMLIEHTDAYQYKANYYNRTAGTKIFFLPQKGDFSPICFGLDPEDNSKLTDDPDAAKPIVLEQANVYYEITFDTKESTYAVSTYPVTSAANRLPQAIGSNYELDPAQPGNIIPFQIGILGNLPGCNGSPSGILVFTQDATNPNLFYSDEITLEAGSELNFIIHNKHDWGWWDYCLWRVDNSDDPEIFIYGGADANPKPQDIWGKPTVITSGTYKFWFDAHLERGKLVRVN
ncbi:hypothetical protein [Proteiniphilum sp.]|uniref:hypothetical protein n=1 Tax=Proteiniphilum sp. TaxID=1926877 RepID=UPI00331CEAAF